MRKMWLVLAFGGALALLLAPSLFAQWEPDRRLSYATGISSTTYNNAKSVAASGDLVHVVWWDERDNNKEIYFRRSTTGGTDWFPEFRLTNRSDAQMDPSVAASGSAVHVVWADERDEPGWFRFVLFYARSLDGGASWNPQDYRLTSSTSGTCPSVAVSNQLVHVAWQDDRLMSGKYINKIYYKRSTTGGNDWGGDQCLVDHSTADRYAIKASIAASGQFVHLVWEDDNDHPAANHPQIYYKVSTDGGGEWSGDFRLSYFKQG